ncbi:response regulator [Xylophilus sp. GW821-FHT01B05]
MFSPPSLPSDSTHILLIDDNLDELRLLADILRSARYRLSVALDGAQGYHRAVASPPDLILLDVSMPRMDGFATARLLKAHAATAAVPIIFLSAASTLEERLQGLRVGGVDYVLKPFDAEEVLARIQVHLTLAGNSAPLPKQVAAPEGDDADAVFVRAAMRYLTLNLRSEHSLDSVAHAVGTHSKRLSRAFRAQLSQTVFEFLRQERLREAQRLLSQTSLGVLDVAAEVGFASAANFATAFREQVGVTPTAYRRQSARR